ncbi:ankyrin [Neocallimastix californiae]|uniref:Ankyrin n=1 Tax=Neocallimastix californiae TaxID=1754190 RepID=A0A1Y1YCT6_9FUNG|nr:ankyrin [Neocallimastix californiae]|eukprot:ORX95802.1 ankyrin [Neocallimastix californiae]
MEKILSYKNLNLEKFDFEKIYTDLSCQKKDDIPSINDNHIDVTNIKNCNSTFLILILNVAIQIADINLVKCIMENEELKSKFDINNRDNDGNEAIMVALYSPVSNYFNGKRQIKCDEIFKYLLENGVNCNKKINIITFINGCNIFWKLYDDKYFLKQNLIIEKSSIDNNYSPLLRESIYQNRVVDFESLMQHNEFNKIDNSISIQKNVFTPLVFAYLSNYTDIFKILLEKTDINEKDGFKNTLLFYAILKEDIPTIEYLIKNNVDINFEDKFSNSALDISLKINNIKIFNMILNHRNLKLYTINSQLETPFSVIIKSRYYNIEKKLSMIKSLIDKGFDLNKPDGYRKSALAYSIEENLLPIIKLLIENRANVNFVGGNGNSPLGYAIQKKSLPIVKLLVNNGAKIIA